MEDKSSLTPFFRARGFTLVEVVVAIVLMGMLAMAVTPVISSSVQAYQDTTAQLAALSKLRYATERMAREIRDLRRNPVTPANYDISAMTATNLVFVKSDGNQVTINAAPPLVTLGYQTPAASATLTDQVTALAFRYLDINNAVTASVAQIAFVEISLTLGANGGSLQQRTRVALRNLQ